MTPRPTASTPVGGTTPTRDQDIGQTIRDAVEQAQQEAAQEARAATQEVREAQQRVRDAQQQVRDAQQQLRDAQQQLRDATTGDQRGAANQAIFGAQQAIRAAEQELRRVEGQTQSTPVIYTSQPPDFPQPVIPPAAVDIAIGFFITCAVMVVGWPIARALGRRFERRGTSPVVDAGVAEQLQRIEQAVEAVAIEVERISESQRFLARLQEKSPSALE
jgi:hypothetical protein